MSLSQSLRQTAHLAVPSEMGEGYLFGKDSGDKRRLTILNDVNNTVAVHLTHMQGRTGDEAIGEPDHKLQ